MVISPSSKSAILSGAKLRRPDLELQLRGAEIWRASPGISPRWASAQLTDTREVQDISRPHLTNAQCMRQLVRRCANRDLLWANLAGATLTGGLISREGFVSKYIVKADWLDASCWNRLPHAHSSERCSRVGKRAH